MTKGISRDEICRKTKIPSSGELTKKLKELESCGFIRKYVPFGAESKNALYQLIDNYTLFYNRFLKANKYDENYWKSASNSGEVNAWSGLAFDKAMRRRIADLRIATKTKYAIHSTLITTYEVKETPYSGNIQAVITADKLFD